MKSQAFHSINRAASKHEQITSRDRQHALRPCPSARDDRATPLLRVAAAETAVIAPVARDQKRGSSGPVQQAQRVATGARISPAPPQFALFG